MENVTRIIYEAVKSVKPHVEVSLAATPSLKWSRRAYGVDWVKLAKEELSHYTPQSITPRQWITNTGDHHLTLACPITAPTLCLTPLILLLLSPPRVSRPATSPHSNSFR